MKKQKPNPRQTLHIVTAEEAASVAQPPQEPEPDWQTDRDRLVASGLRRYQQLQHEVDQALFARPQEVDALRELLPELELVRQRLASYGVHVQR